MSWELNWGWQEWGVALLIALCILRLSVRLRTFFRGMKKNNSPCGSCASGCELKSQLGKKKQGSKVNQSSGKKKSCG